MDERIIRKEVINASLDVHPLQTALVIDYDEGAVREIKSLTEQYPFNINIRVRQQFQILNSESRC
jgi:hypothetical protein